MILTIKRVTPAAAVPAPTPVVVQPQPSVAPAAIPLPLTDAIAALRQGQIRVSPSFTLEAGEEMTIQAEIVYADGARSRDFALESSQKEIVSINADRRTIRALKEGKAQLTVFDPTHSHIRTQVHVEVKPATSALIELEIEYKE